MVGFVVRIRVMETVRVHITQNSDRNSYPPNLKVEMCGTLIKQLRVRTRGSEFFFPNDVSPGHYLVRWVRVKG